MINITNHKQPPLLLGYYTPETLAPIIENMFKRFNIKIPTQINQPTGKMIIYNTTIHKHA